MTLDQIKSNFVSQFATSEVPVRHFPQQMSAAVTTVSYQAGRRTWQTDESRARAGIVAGMIGPKGRKIVSYGESPELDGDAVFEIGSVTKVFTSLLLADMVQRGQVALTDPVAKYLPSEVNVPQRGGRQITLVDLATHTSGLPRVPSNLKPRGAPNPYADYSVAQLYEFIGSYELPREIGSAFEYSNVGVGLLGHALALRAEMDYGALVRAHITGPLGMNDTAIDLSPQMKARLAVGYDCKSEPVANWDLPTLAGGGALRSTANDMLTFLEATLGYSNTPLAPAFAAMLEAHRPTTNPEVEIALGWHIFKRPDAVIVGHGGMTGGYTSFIGYEPAARVGTAVLSNAEWVGVDAIGLHLLNPKAALLG